MKAPQTPVSISTPRVTRLDAADDLDGAAVSAQEGQTVVPAQLKPNDSSRNGNPSPRQ